MSTGQEPSENKDQVNQIELYKEYCRDRKVLLEHRVITIQMLDKTLLTINTGAFIVSFTYVFQLFSKGHAHSIGLLIFGWIAMAVAIISNIIAQFLAYKLCNWRLSENDLLYKKGSGQSDPLEDRSLTRLSNRNERWDRVSNFLSNSQVALTSASIVLILIFVSINAFLFPN